MSSSRLFILPFFFILLVQSNDDPSLDAGTVALPLTLKAKRMQEQVRFEPDPTTMATSTKIPQATLSEGMNGEGTTPVNIERVREGRMRFLTTIYNDRPLMSQLTTPSVILPTTTVTSLNELLLTIIPSTRTSSPSATIPTKLSLSKRRHGKEKVIRQVLDVQRPDERKVDPDSNEEPPMKVNGHMSATTASQTLVTPFEQRDRCVNEDAKEFINSATTCNNDRPNRICALLFRDPNPKTGWRDPKCNVAGMEDIAESCRKQCGICCEHIDYACEDDSNKIIDCNKQLDKCQMNKWFDVLARFCAGSCGLCTKTECRDFSAKCREMKNLCLDQKHIDYMRANWTCGFCVVGPGGISEHPLKRLPIPACVDHASNCTENEALCSSPMHAEFMIKYCAKTCFKCTGDAGSQVIVPVIGTSPELNGTAAVLVPASVIMGAARPDSSTSECVDHHPKCAIWVAKGFCTHNKYTNEQRFALCPRSCKLC